MMPVTRKQDQDDPTQAMHDLAPDVTQRRASDPRASVWVNASAGSGKTSVLTSRVLRLLLAGVKPQKILCLTFTKAAAAEMSIRIMDRLSLWAICSDDELRSDLDRLQGMAPESDQLTTARRLFAQVLACPGGMRIRTIHAFCQEILRRFPVEAGLPPHFTVIEESEADRLIKEAERDLLRHAAANADSELGQALRYLVNELGSTAFSDALRQFLHDRARFDAAHRRHGIDALRLNLRNLLGLEPGDAAAAVIADAVALAPTDLRHAAGILLQASKSFVAVGRAILDWLDLPIAQRVEKFASYCDCFFTQKGEPRSKLADKATLTKYPEIDAILRREAMRLQNVRERLDAVRMAETTHAVALCAKVLIDGYQTRKRLQAALDYDDLIIQTTALLQRASIIPWVLYKLDEGLDHMLVDEAQDTSRAQWRIIAALAEEFFAGRGAREDVARSLFVVGDEKQSIFSFQRADPAAFLQMRQHFSEKIQLAEKLYREVPLQVSFRSAPAVLQAVDYVFAADAARNGVSVDPVRHYAHRAEKVGRVEVWPLQQAPKDPTRDGPWQVPDKYEEEIDPQAELADQIADVIKGWLKRGEVLPGTERPMAAGDIMILLRRRGRFADLMVRALKKRDVPVTGVDRMRLVKQLPVMDMLALLQFVLLPEDDLNLATVLRGPLLGLSEDQLMSLAIGRDGTLWQSLKDKAGQDGALQESVAYLQRWLNQADFVTPFAMLAALLHQPCPGDKRSGRRALWARLGLDALDPIDELLNAAQHFSLRHAPSLQCFLHWLSAADAEIKRELDQGAGQVRIMTVHAAKGLEAPIVFLPDAAGMPRSQDVDTLLWYGEEAAELTIPLYAAKRPTMGLPRQLWEQARQKQMQEYRRLLYVALTRAVNRLYIAGWVTTEKESQNPDSWYNLVKDALQPYHQPAAVLDDGPEAVIVVADAHINGPLAPVKPKPAAPEKSPSINTLPAWALTSPGEEAVLLQALVPSHGVLVATAVDMLQPATATPDDAFSRGRIIHRLLQSLPDLPGTQRDIAAARFLANPQHGLGAEQQVAMKDEVMKLLNDPAFAPLFGTGSRAEVPLAGRIDGQDVSGQVDRLCLRGDEIWIVDYKTNRPPPLHVKDVPELYRRQLAAYRLVLKAIYPGKAVRCFLLWTYGPRLMELPPDAVAHLN